MLRKPTGSLNKGLMRRAVWPPLLLLRRPLLYSPSEKLMQSVVSFVRIVVAPLEAMTTVRELVVITSLPLSPARTTRSGAPSPSRAAPAVCSPIFHSQGGRETPTPAVSYRRPSLLLIPPGNQQEVLLRSRPAERPPVSCGYWGRILHLTCVLGG